MDQEYPSYFKNKNFLISFLSSIFILVISIIVNFYAVIYAVEKSSSSVTDIILNNIRVYDVDGIFIYGPILMWLLVAFILLRKLQYAPFTLKSVSLFIIIRSVFTILTHIGPFPTHVNVPLNGIISYFTSAKDLFFSGHTGLPFLLALIFWDNMYLRILFTLSSILFGTVVLMGHLHYSIDVLSAFFITYTIYHISEIIFSRDKKLFKYGLISN